MEFQILTNVLRPVAVIKVECSASELLVSRGRPAYFSLLNELEERYFGMRDLRHLKAMIALVNYN